MPFAPIAIVGQACVLPGASDPAALWDAIAAGRDLIGPVPAGRWRVAPAHILAASPQAARDRTWSDRGGYVREARAVAGEELDPVFQWILQCGRKALRGVQGDRARAGAIIGNLSFPSASLARLAEQTWRGELQGTDPRNRFMSGLPAHLLASELGLGAGALALDAACASSLYAIKLACDWLHTGRADLMLAGAVNATDDLFIHVGFSALQALSLTGRSRPFHRDADGLVPAEGAALVALKRLEDAVAAGDDILGVIRGVGLANDGRGGGLLVPSEAGQERAMRLAYAAAGLAPADISLIECHATGTRLGDAAELRSTGRVFAGCRDVPIGSLKSNLGHLITVAGAAGLLKVLAAMRAKVRPPTLHADEPLDALQGSPFRLLNRAEPWESDGPRRAAISSFGFGGNNAHLIVEEWVNDPKEGILVHPLPTSPFEGEGSVPRGLRDAEASPGDAEASPGDAEASPGHADTSPGHAETSSRDQQPSGRRTLSPGGGGPEGGHKQSLPYPRAERDLIAIVAIEVRAASGQSTADFVETLLTGVARVAGGRAAATEVTVAATGLRFPPRDLEQALPQQLVMLEVARAALAQARVTSPLRTGVLVGMQCDAEVARYGTRWRLAEELNGAALEQARDGVCPPLAAPGVLGTMPNIPANRINSQCDLGGPSFTVAAEELSGIRALEIAAHALRSGELDAAMVGAVDMSCEPVHEAAARQALPADRQVPGDAAVALVLKRLEDARRDGDKIYAVLPDATSAAPDLRLGLATGSQGLTPLFGHAHAASGLLHVAAAALACHYRFLPGEVDRPASPWLPAGPSRTAVVTIEALGGQRATVGLAEDAQTPAGRLSGCQVPRLHVYSGTDRQAVVSAVTARRESGEGPARLVVVAADETELAARLARACQHLQASAGQDAPGPGEGIYYRDVPLGGEVAFVFNAPGGAHRGMGRDLLLAAPVLADRLAARFPRVREAAGWVYEPDNRAVPPLNTLMGASSLALVHAELTRGVLGLRPQAAIGFCSGESTALLALGAWNDLDAFYQEIMDAGVFSRELAGDFAAIRRAWGEPTIPVTWETWRVVAPEEALQAAVDAEARVYLTIRNAPGDCVIAGDAGACARVLARVGAERAQRMDYNIAVHCPEMAEFAASWRRLHHRKTAPVPGIRFYTHADGGHYSPDADLAADALLGQASHTVDFPQLIENAWRDGVRVFIEHGPQAGCSHWIRRILGDRDHLAVPLDRSSQSSLVQAVLAMAQLVAAGVPVDVDAFYQLLGPEAPPVESGPLLRFPAHPPPVHLSPALAVQVMVPAPPLYPVLTDLLCHETLASVEHTLASGEETLSPGGGGPEGGRQIIPSLSARPQKRRDFSYPLPTSSLLSPFVRLASSPTTGAPFQGEGLVSGTAGMTPQAIAAQRSVAAYRQTVLRQMQAWGITVPQAQATVTAVVARAVPEHVPAEAAPASYALPRPLFSRADLEHLASGRISDLFGPGFQQQDRYERQVRMPEPPLLLADRVTRIEAEPGSMGLGTIWTETDVRWDSWYLNQGYMPAGVMIEAGQADLLLISWLGIDAHNRGQRVYRLLGCELTYHGGLPRPGDTLRYDIHVDGHANHGDVRLFFFHYDCRIGDEVCLSVRHGQAGFFSDEELANSMGILWSPEANPPGEGARVAPPVARCERSRFTAEQVRAFAAGDAFGCFGPGFETAQAHLRTPGIQQDRMLFLDEVTAFEPGGGPWTRGYLRAETRISPDDWFFPGHFKNDPCMPGTLMFEGCLQAMAFYLAGLGYTLSRDGWRFEPVPDEAYQLRCRGQVTPDSRLLAYEVFVEEVVDGPVPTLYADLLCSVDGLKIFHCRRMGLQLVPDWPATSRPQVETKALPVASIGELALDEAAMLAIAWGKPSDAYGPRFAAFDRGRRLPRLPGPPYHFMSRVTRLTGELGDMREGGTIELAYDIPPDAWYFGESGTGRMPFCVLLEAALQPCGWLANYVGVPLHMPAEVRFRNLDGSGAVAAEIPPGGGTLRTRATLTSLSRSAGMSIQTFDVACTVGDETIFTLKTAFGHFPDEALAQQVGLAPSPEELAGLAEPCDFLVDLTTWPARARLAGPRLLMLDRVTGYWPGAGKAGLGRLRAEKDVNAAEWFFKAHFFQDPVQPGSLGLEAMLQLLQFYMIERNMAAPGARFESIALDRPLTWKYRGQVLPTDRRITVELEITETGRDARGAYAVAEAWLWVDGRRIYQARDLAVRVVL